MVTEDTLSLSVWKGSEEGTKPDNTLAVHVLSKAAEHCGHESKLAVRESWSSWNSRSVTTLSFSAGFLIFNICNSTYKTETVLVLQRLLVRIKWDNACREHQLATC